MNLRARPLASESLQKRIRRLRQENGLTLQAVATKVGGITPAAVSHWESGRTEPTPDKLRLLAKALKVSESELKGASPSRSAPRPTKDVFSQIDEIVADAERRIAEAMGRPASEVTVSYTVGRRS